MPLGEGNKHVRVTVDLCKLAYDDGKDRAAVEKEICTLLNIPNNQIRWFDVKAWDTQSLVVTTNDTVYLAFPGTASVTDAIVDAAFDLVPFMNGHCHRMFLLVSQETFKEIGEAIKKDLTQGNKKLVITGHSLGGALAMLYAALFKNEKPEFPIDYLITYGQPRCGNKDFVTTYGLMKINYVRFLNLGDIVPDVPPPFRKSNWSHAGRGLIFDNGKMRDTIDSDEASVMNRFLSLLFSLAFGFLREKKVGLELYQKSKAFHNMSLYKENIQKHFPEA